MSHMTSPVVYS